MTGYAVENIFLSKDGRRAKARYKANVDAQFPPDLWRGYKRYKVGLPAEDFWEKVGDEWYVPIMKKKTSICGVTLGYYWIPANDSDWEKMEFVEFNADSLIPEKKPEATQRPQN